MINVSTCISTNTKCFRLVASRHHAILIIKDEKCKFWKSNQDFYIKQQVLFHGFMWSRRSTVNARHATKPVMQHVQLKKSLHIVLSGGSKSVSWQSTKTWLANFSGQPIFGLTDRGRQRRGSTVSNFTKMKDEKSHVNLTSKPSRVMTVCCWK